jgi:hypothetical protein
MGFKLITTAKSAAAKGFTASYRISKKGIGTLFVSVPSSVAGKIWGHFDRCNFLLGHDEDAGRLMIQGASKTGEAKIGRMKTSLVFRVPQQPDWLGGEFETCVIERVSEGVADGRFLLVLPPQLFSASPAVDRILVDKPLAPAVAPRVDALGRPPLSIVGTTLELNGKRVKLNAQYFKVFSLLWKGWGESIRSSYIATSFQDDIDVEKAIKGLQKDLEPLGLCVAPTIGGSAYKLVLKA